MARLLAFIVAGLFAFGPLGLFASSLSLPQTPPRIVQAPAVVPDPMVGLSSITVHVVEDANARPIKGAQVTAVVIAEATFVKNTITDRTGRALLLGLAKGRVRISSGHQGFLSATYGAERPGEDGTYITISEGQQVPTITIRLKRGAVVAGTITSEHGDPLVGVVVQAFRRMYSGGRPVFSAVQELDFTDDRGAYRIRNLIPGDYLVGVVPRSRNDALIPAASEADAEMPEAYVDPAAPGNAIVMELGEGRVMMMAYTEPMPLIFADRALAYTPTFFPGTPAATASVITLGPAESRSGVDFSLDPIPAVPVIGKVVALEGGLIRATATLAPVADAGRLVDSVRHSATTDESGVFQFGVVPRGQYTLDVRANPNEPSRSPAWASVPLSVAAAPVTDLVVTLNPGMTVSGEVRYASSDVESAVGRLSGVEVQVTPVPMRLEGTIHMRTALGLDGRFEVRHLPPGDYTLRVTGLPYGWLASSARLDGRDIFDTGLRIQPGTNLERLLVTITDRMPEVNGVLRDRADRAVSSGWVILFSSDKAHWTGSGRRMQGARPGTEGQFVFRNVPPGTYLLAAADAEPGQWLDPAFLEQLAPRAIRVVVRDGATPPGPGIVLRK